MDRADRSPGAGPATRRLFVAVPLDARALTAVAGLVAELRADEALARAGHGGDPGDRRSAVRWVRPEGIHLTLRFLGPTLPSRVMAAAAAVTASVTGVGPFPVRLAGGGAYPRPSAPRVLWLGVAEGTDQLADLARRLEATLAAAGWPPADRPFAAHLTLGRSSDALAARPVAEALVRRAAALAVSWTADRLVLFESRLGPGGARYEEVRVAVLSG